MRGSIGVKVSSVVAMELAAKEQAIASDSVLSLLIKSSVGARSSCGRLASH